MIEALKFTLSGKNAFFKKPDVNTYLYFTYGHIHKVALLGILGAIVGYDGYGQKKWTKTKKDEYIEEYPEFYEKLKDLKVSIMPSKGCEYIAKKVHTFNNSVGYASKETGGNLIVKEQWLEDPSWDIYIILDTDEAKNIAEYILNRKTIYTPYLGKNDHLADISSPEKIEIEKKSFIGDSISIKSLYPKDIGKIDLEGTEELEEEYSISFFKYEERLPLSLDGKLNKYETVSFVFTNMLIEIKNDESLFDSKDGVLAFY